MCAIQMDEFMQNHIGQLMCALYERLEVAGRLQRLYALEFQDFSAGFESTEFPDRPEVIRVGKRWLFSLSLRFEHPVSCEIEVFGDDVALMFERAAVIACATNLDTYEARMKRGR